MTDPHTDPGNLSWGRCVITSCGKFNADLGGHIVLWDLGLVVRFPPGSTIILPSALLTHSNVKIQPGEERFSLTQYTAGGLLRWVYNGFVSDKSLLARLRREGGAAEYAKWEGDRKARFEEGLQSFGMFDDLLS